MTGRGRGGGGFLTSTSHSGRGFDVALSVVDRALIQRCLKHQPGSWNDFVDRFLGLIYHVVHHTSYLRSFPLPPEDVEDVAAETLLQIIADDYAVLRQFRGQSSLATYLTVIARRICVQELTRRSAAREVQVGPRAPEPEAKQAAEPRSLERLEEVQKLLRKLPARERQVVRLSYLEGRSYEEISTELNIPVNSIGPILSRARQRLRKGVKYFPGNHGQKPPKELAAQAPKPTAEKPEEEVDSST